MSRRKRIERRITNPELIKTIRLLRKNTKDSGARIWKDIAERLSRPNKRRVAVNISRLNRHTVDGDTVLVPGKVLGSGRLTHPITVAAFSFSETAKSKVAAAKGRCLSIIELMEENREGRNVKIIG